MYRIKSFREEIEDVENVNTGYVLKKFSSERRKVNHQPVEVKITSKKGIMWVNGLRQFVG